MFLKVKESGTGKTTLLNLDLVQKFESSGIDTIAKYINGDLFRIALTVEEVEIKIMSVGKEPKTKNKDN